MKYDENEQLFFMDYSSDSESDDDNKRWSPCPWWNKIFEEWFKDHGRFHPLDERREIERDERRKRREQREQAGGKRRRVIKPADARDLEMEEFMWSNYIVHSSDYSSNSESDDGNQSGFGYDNSKQNHKKRQRDGYDEGDDGEGITYCGDGDKADNGEEDRDEAKENRNNGNV
jgi:hypothetical protein